MKISDRRLAELLQHSKTLEGALRRHMETEDQAERDQAVIARRLVVPLVNALETWISVRALRQQLRHAPVHHAQSIDPGVPLTGRPPESSRRSETSG